MKFFGLTLLSLIPIFLGAQKKHLLLQEGKIKEALIRFFTAIRFEIDSFSRSQKDIFMRYENIDLQKIGFLPFLQQEVEKDACGALFRSVCSLLENESFSKTEKEALLNFSENFGMQSKSAQLSDCDKLLSVLQREEEQRKEKRKADASAAWTSGLCIGIGLFILMI